MVILGIETSCDETALSLLEVDESGTQPLFRVLAHKVLSQTIHAQFGGVFPMMAKREHGRNLIPLFQKVLKESGFDSRSMIHESGIGKEEARNHSDVLENLRIVLEREPELSKQFVEFVPTLVKLKGLIDIIAVTTGPGLEPALWVGINFARALSALWDIPIVPTNHMEGHIFAALIKHGEEAPNHKLQIPNREKFQIPDLPDRQAGSEFQILLPAFPAIALLISGGHTELVLMKEAGAYEVIGETRDDAVGEAFDKVARIMGLPYPGGPQISALAEQARRFENQDSGIRNQEFKLPRPMIKDASFDFSFSGLKTAVLYAVKKHGLLSDADKSAMALEFENAVTDVLVAKTKGAIEMYAAKTLILGGGVAANIHIRSSLGKLVEEIGDVELKIPETSLSTDNALMIAIAGYFSFRSQKTASTEPLKASGRLRF